MRDSRRKSRNLDDLVLVPLGLWLALRMIPEAVLSEAEERVRGAEKVSPRVRAFGAAVVVFIWIALLGFGAWLFLR